MFIFNYLLAVHIFFGTIALFASVTALSSAKGKKLHRHAGRYFFWAMTGIFVTAIPMSLIIASEFLLCIAIFSYYLAYTGQRYVLRGELLATGLDYAVSYLMLLLSILMISAAGWL